VAVEIAGARGLSFAFQILCGCDGNDGELADLARDQASPTFSTRGLRQRFWWGEGVRKRVASKGRVGNSPVV